MTGNGMKKYVPYIWVDPQEFYVKTEDGSYEDFDSSDDNFLAYNIDNAELTSLEKVKIIITTISNEALFTFPVKVMHSDGTTSTVFRTVQGNQIGFTVYPGENITYGIKLGDFYINRSFTARYSTNIYEVPTFESPLSLPTNSDRILPPDLILNDIEYRYCGAITHLEDVMQGLNDIDKTLLIDYTYSAIICPNAGDTVFPEWKDSPHTYTVDNIEFKQANIKYYDGNNFEYFKDIYTTNNEAIYFIGSQAASYLNIKPGVYTKFVLLNYRPGDFYWYVIESITLRIT